jgi:hypothetical protein
MIVQLINNISWASLLVSESQAWHQETPRFHKKPHTAKNRIRREQAETKGLGINNV